MKLRRSARATQPRASNPRGKIGAGWTPRRPILRSRGVVVTSNRPLPTANEDVLEKANAGRSETINVLANDFTPFSDTPLKIVSVAVETGSAAGQPVSSGDSITVTPADGPKGVMVLRYTVSDKNDDPSRQVNGRVRITVRDKPDRPSAPTATNVRSRTEVLKWAPLSDNGATITGYTVRSNNGFEQKCATTTCTLGGLTNDVKYVFTVIATNEAGDSQPSPQSNEIRPDQKPSPPEAPTVKAGDKDMVINCLPAKTVSYTYNASTGQNGPITRGQTVGGFTNGTQTTITVIAHSTVAPSSNASAGASTTTYGSPGTPSASGQNGAMNQKSLTLSWSSPSTATYDVVSTRISVDGGGWEKVIPSGSRLINTGGFSETHRIDVKTVNSLGTESGVVSASASSGAEGEWITTVVKGTDLVRTCTFEYGKASYRPSPYFDCQGVNNGDTPPWLYVNERIVVYCYVMMNDQWTTTPDQPFYRIEPGSNRNVGFYMVARRSQLDLPYSHGIPQC